MYSVNPCFEKEVADIVEKINRIRTEKDLCFAVCTDSHWQDACEQSRANIAAVDHAVSFDFMVHLGNLTNGTNPERITRRVLREELTAFRQCTAKQKLFVTLGDTDGYRDETFLGQLVCHIMRDDIWHQDTAFIDSYPEVCRHGDDPYYYVDFSAKKIRLIFLCSSRYEYDAENKLYERYASYGIKQIAWLKNEALRLPEGWTVLLFSHEILNSEFGGGKGPFIYNGFSGDKLLSLLQKAKRTDGVSVVGMMAGHYGFDAEDVVGDINHFVIGQIAPLVSKEVPAEKYRALNDRTLDTVNQDLWDACVLKTEEHKLYLFRFGAGEDRAISY